MTPRRLLKPLPLARFLKEVWGETPLHLRGARSRFAGLFSWRILNQLLATQRLEPPRLRLAQAGVPTRALEPIVRYRTTPAGRQDPHLDVPALNRALARGATLILSAAHDMHPPLAAMTREFANLFLAEPNVNAYATFGRQSGFGPHWDHHDVFILHIAGRKRWVIYGASRRYPLFRDVRTNGSRPLRAQSRHWLQPGDLLYIPRGHWHDALAVDEPTLHLTLGVPTASGIDFLNWLADDMRAVELARKNIPLFDARRSADWLRLVARAVAARLDDDTLARFLDERRAMLEPSPDPALPHAVHRDYAARKQDLLRWTGSARATLLTRTRGVVVRAAGREFEFDPAAAPLIAQLLTGATVSYGALERSYARRLGPRRLRRLIGELLHEHFVTIVPSR
jgi:ribosomal protein L16 Arg81 hydroxylase